MLFCRSLSSYEYYKVFDVFSFLFFFFWLNRRFSYHSIHMHVMYIFKNPDHEPSEFIWWCQRVSPYLSKIKKLIILSPCVQICNYLLVTTGCLAYLSIKKIKKRMPSTSRKNSTGAKKCKKRTSICFSSQQTMYI